jgi:hypothetical protein
MNLKRLIAFTAEWFVRAEFTSRIMGLVLRLLQVAMFCKIFDMRPEGYLITACSFIVLFIATSWCLDKTSLRRRIEGETGRRSEPVVEILQRLERIENGLKG